MEDDPRVLRLERMVLEKEGFSVVTSGSGEEALEMLAEITPSLIVLDVGLPGIDGFTACSRIREFSQVSIIMVTGKDFNEDKVRGLDLGADDYQALFTQRVCGAGEGGAATLGDEQLGYGADGRGWRATY